MARDIYVFAVSNGSVYKINVASQVKTAVTGGTSLLSTTSTAIMSAAATDGNLYYVDGSLGKYYDAASDQMKDWPTNLSGGEFPHSGSDYPRLITLWRSRIVLSGINSDPHNWFMSRMGSPRDFNYGADPNDAKRAVAGNNTNTGLPGDLITALIAYDKDRLIFGGDHTLWLMTGDPTRGGEIEMVSSSTGIAFGKAWAMDPNQTVYFFGTNGVYRYIPGGKPECISAGRLDGAFRAVNLSTHRVRLEWDRAFARLYVFITRIADGSSTHYVWEQRTDAWWIDQYPDNHGPFATYVLDADSPNDRVVLLGGRDGYIRKFDPTSLSDDGTAISSSVVLAPVRSGDHNYDQVLSRLIITNSDDTTEMSYDVRAAASAEDVVLDSATKKIGGSYSSTLAPGRHVDDRRRVRGNAIAIRLHNSTLGKTWGVEDITMEIESGGNVRKPV